MLTPAMRLRDSPPVFGWPGRVPPRAAQPGDPGGRYLGVLGLLLLGYALFSKPFAYLGVPPVYIGEAILVLGLVQLLRVRSWSWLLEHPAWALLGLLGALTLARTVPMLGPYGLDAARDAMLVGYALFAVVMAALVVERPERLPTLVRRYRVLAVAVVLFGWAIFLVVKTVGESLPSLPWAADVPVLESKAGDLLVHLAGITAFIVVGFVRRRPWLLGFLALSVGLAVVSTRGGMVAWTLGVGAAWLLRPPTARVGGLAYAFAALVTLGVLLGPDLTVNGGTRMVSVEQVWLNVQSLFGSAGTETLDGSRTWRERWWGEIWDYTVHGPYFWQGKGYGVNLAVADGFSVSEDHALRSPHNGHLTVLARSGVPGFVLWGLVQLAWLGSVLRAWLAARRAGRWAWMGLFAVLVAFWTAASVNGAFDVYLEGPMGGVWFWSVWGIGLAAAGLQRRHPDLLDGLLHRAAVPPPQPPAWTWGGGAPGPSQETQAQTIGLGRGTAQGHGPRP